jgi:hypothetical protein
MRQSLEQLLCILIAMVILLFTAFYNNFIFVYPDTGTYIRSGFEMLIPIDRPIYYGIFLRIASLSFSLWYVAIVQSLILAYLLFLVFYSFFNNENYKIYFLITVFLLTFTTGISFNVCMITADIFTAYLFISWYLLLFGNGLSVLKKFSLVVIFIVSMICHLSHASVIILCCCGLLLVYSFRKYLKIQFPFSFKKLVAIIGFSIIAILTTPVLNYFISGNFIFSQAGHVFLINKIHEDGMLEEFLNEHCSEKQYLLCKEKDKLPWDLIWDSKSPITRDGDWNKFKEDDNQIIIDVLTEPKYLKVFLLKSIQQTFRQFFNFNTGDAPTDEICKPALISIEKFFPYDLKEFLSSRQMLDPMNFDNLNYTQLLIVFFSFLILLISMFTNKLVIHSSFKSSIIFLLIFLVSNAMICSMFSSVLGRYQSRIIWLIPLFTLILIYKLTIHIYLDIKEFIQLNLFKLNSQ